MSEEYYCLLGRVPKIFSYVNNGAYVRTMCKLKDHVDCFMLNEFFNMVYSLKLEIWESNFSNVFCTLDLIKCFKLILKENTFINLRELCCLVKYFDVNINSSILFIIRQFFDMFEFIDERVFSLDNDGVIKLIALNSSELFYKEVESIFYNSQLFDSIYNEKNVRIRKLSYVKVLFFLFQIK